MQSPKKRSSKKSESRLVFHALNLSTYPRIKDAIGKKEDLKTLLSNMPCKDNQDLMYYSNYDYCTLLFHCCSNCYPKGLTQVLTKIIQQCDSQEHLIRVCNYGFQALNAVNTQNNKRKKNNQLSKPESKENENSNQKQSVSTNLPTSFSNFTKVLQGLGRNINCGIIEAKSDTFNFLQCAWILIIVGSDVDYPALIESNAKTSINGLSSSKSKTKTKKTTQNSAKNKNDKNKSKNKSEKQKNFCHLLDIVYKLHIPDLFLALSLRSQRIRIDFNKALLPSCNHIDENKVNVNDSKEEKECKDDNTSSMITIDDSLSLQRVVDIFWNVSFEIGRKDLQFCLKMDDYGLDVFGRALWHYHQKNEKEFVKLMQKSNKELQMASMLTKTTIKHLKSIVLELKNKNYNIYGNNGDYKNDDVSNSDNNNHNSNNNEMDPCLLLWSRPPTQHLLSLHIFYNPLDTSSNNGNYDRLGLQRFAKTMVVCYLLNKIIIETVDIRTKHEDKSGKIGVSNVDKKKPLLRKARSMKSASRTARTPRTPRTPGSLTMSPKNKDEDENENGKKNRSVINSSDCSLLLDCIANHCQLFGVLTFIELKNVLIDLNGIKLFIQGLIKWNNKSANKELKHLSFINANLNNQCIYSLCNGLKESANDGKVAIRRLILNNNPFGIGGIGAICRMLDPKQKQKQKQRKAISMVSSNLYELHIRDCGEFGFYTFDFPVRLYLTKIGFQTKFNVMLKNTNTTINTTNYSRNSKSNSNYCQESREENKESTSLLDSEDVSIVTNATSVKSTPNTRPLTQQANSKKKHDKEQNEETEEKQSTTLRHRCEKMVSYYKQYFDKIDYITTNEIPEIPMSIYVTKNTSIIGRNSVDSVSINTNSPNTPDTPSAKTQSFVFPSPKASNSGSRHNRTQSTVTPKATKSRIKAKSKPIAASTRASTATTKSRKLSRNTKTPKVHAKVKTKTKTPKGSAISQLDRSLSTKKSMKLILESKECDTFNDGEDDDNDDSKRIFRSNAKVPRSLTPDFSVWNTQIQHELQYCSKLETQVTKNRELVAIKIASLSPNTTKNGAKSIKNNTTTYWKIGNFGLSEENVKKSRRVYFCLPQESVGKHQIKRQIGIVNSVTSPLITPTTTAPATPRTPKTPKLRKTQSYQTIKSPKRKKSGLNSSHGSQHDGKRVKKTRDYMVYDYNRKYLLFNIETIDNVLINISELQAFDIEYLHILCKEDLTINIIGRSIEKRKSTLTNDDCKDDNNDANINTDKGNSERGKNVSKSKMKLIVGDMISVVARNINIVKNAIIDTARLWLCGESVFIGENCQINDITCWVEAFNFDNRGSMNQIGHSWFTSPNTNGPSNKVFQSIGTKSNKKCVWINRKSIVTHGYFYANVDKFELDSQSIIDCGVLFHVKTNDFNQKYNSQCNINGSAMINCGNSGASLNGCVNAALLVLSITGNLSIGGSIEWSTQLIISCDERLAIEPNARIESVINKDNSTLTRHLINLVGVCGGPAFRDDSGCSPNGVMLLLFVKSKEFECNRAKILNNYENRTIYLSIDKKLVVDDGTYVQNNGPTYISMNNGCMEVKNSEIDITRGSFSVNGNSIWNENSIFTCNNELHYNGINLNLIGNAKWDLRGDICNIVIDQDTLIDESVVIDVNTLDLKTNNLIEVYGTVRHGQKNNGKILIYGDYIHCYETSHLAISCKYPEKDDTLECLRKEFDKLALTKDIDELELKLESKTDESCEYRNDDNSNDSINYLRLSATNKCELEGIINGESSLVIIDAQNDIHLLPKSIILPGGTFLRCVKNITFEGTIKNEKCECFVRCLNTLHLKESGTIIARKCSLNGNKMIMDGTSITAENMKAHGTVQGNIITIRRNEMWTNPFITCKKLVVYGILDTGNIDCIINVDEMIVHQSGTVKAPGIMINRYNNDSNNSNAQNGVVEVLGSINVKNKINSVGMDWNVARNGIVQCKEEINITTNMWNQSGLVIAQGNVSIVCNACYLNHNSQLLFGQECKIESKCAEISGIIDGRLRCQHDATFTSGSCTLAINCSDYMKQNGINTVSGLLSFDFVNFINCNNITITTPVFYQYYARSFDNYDAKKCKINCRSLVNVTLNETGTIVEINDKAFKNGYQRISSLIIPLLIYHEKQLHYSKDISNSHSQFYLLTRIANGWQKQFQHKIRQTAEYHNCDELLKPPPSIKETVIKNVSNFGRSTWNAIQSKFWSNDTKQEINTKNDAEIGGVIQSQNLDANVGNNLKITESGYVKATNTTNINVENNLSQDGIMDLKNGQLNVKHGNHNIGKTGQLKMDDMKYNVGGNSNIDGQLIGNSVDANIGGDLNVNDSGCMQLTGGELNVDGSGNISGDFFGQGLSSANFARNLNVNSGGNMSLDGGLLNVGNNFNVAGSFSGQGVTTNITNDMNVNSGGSMNLFGGSLNAGGNGNINGNFVGLGLSSVSFARDLNINRNGSMSLQGTSLSVGSNLNVNSGGNMNLIGGSMNVVNDANIAGRFTGQNVTTSVGNNLNIASGGNMILQGGSLNVTRSGNIAGNFVGQQLSSATFGNDLNINNGGNMQMYGGSLSVARNMNVNNGGGFTGRGVSATIGNNLNVNNGGSMDLFGGSLNVKNDFTMSGTFTGTGVNTKVGRDLTVGNGGNMSLYGGALSVDNNARIARGGNFTTDGTNIDIGNDFHVLGTAKVENGSIKVGNNGFVGADGSLDILNASADFGRNLDVYGAMNVENASLRAGRDMYIGHGGTVTTKNASVNVENNLTSNGILNVTESEWKVGNNASIYGTLNATQASFDITNTFTSGSSSVMNTENVQFNAKDINQFGTINAKGYLGLKATNEFYQSNNARLNGDTANVNIDAKNKLDLKNANVGSLSLKSDDIVGGEDILYGDSGRGNNIKVKENLSLEKTKGDWNINRSLSRSCGINLVGDSINVAANMYSSKNISLKSTKGSINVYKATIDGENTMLDSANEIVSQASHIRGRNGLTMKAVGDIMNLCIERTYQGAHDTRKTWDKGTFEGGSGGVFIESTNGKIINDASDVVATGNIVFKAKRGVEFKARVHTYVSYKKTSRSGWFGHKKETTIKTKTDSATCNVSSSGGSIQVITDGDFTSVGATFTASQNIIADVKGRASMSSLVLSESTYTSKSSFFGLNKSSSYSYDESEKMNTYAVDMGSIFMRAKGDITGVGAQMISKNGDVSIESTSGNVDFTRRKLNHIREKKERGFKFSPSPGSIGVSFNSSSMRYEGESLGGGGLVGKNIKLKAGKGIHLTNAFNVATLGGQIKIEAKEFKMTGAQLKSKMTASQWGVGLSVGKNKSGYNGSLSFNYANSKSKRTDVVQSELKGDIDFKIDGKAELHGVNVVGKLSGTIEELEMKSMQTEVESSNTGFGIGVTYDGSWGGQVSASHSSSKSKTTDQRTSMTGLAGSTLQVQKANRQSADLNGNISVENDNSSELETYKEENSWGFSVAVSKQGFAAEVSSNGTTIGGSSTGAVNIQTKKFGMKVDGMNVSVRKEDMSFDFDKDNMQLNVKSKDKSFGVGKKGVSYDSKEFSMNLNKDFDSAGVRVGKFGAGFDKDGVNTSYDGNTVGVSKDGTVKGNVCGQDFSAKVDKKGGNVNVGNYGVGWDKEEKSMTGKAFGHEVTANNKDGNAGVGVKGDLINAEISQVRSGVDVAGIAGVSYDKNSKDFNANALGHDVTMNTEKKDLKVSGDLINVQMNHKKTSADVAGFGFSYDKESKDIGGKAFGHEVMVNKDSNDFKVTGDLINAEIGENRFGAEIAGIGGASYDKESKIISGNALGHEVQLNADDKGIKVSGDVINVDVSKKGFSGNVGGLSYDKESGKVEAQALGHEVQLNTDRNEFKVQGDTINAGVNTDGFNAEIDGIGASYNNKTKTVGCKYAGHELAFDHKDKELNVKGDRVNVEVAKHSLDVNVDGIGASIDAQNKTFGVIGGGHDFKGTKDGFNLTGNMINASMSKKNETAAIDINGIGGAIDKKNETYKASGAGHTFIKDPKEATISGDIVNAKLSKNKSFAVDVNGNSVSYDTKEETFGARGIRHEMEITKDGVVVAGDTVNIASSQTNETIAANINGCGFSVDNKKNTWEATAAGHTVAKNSKSMSISGDTINGKLDKEKGVSVDVNGSGVSYDKQNKTIGATHSDHNLAVNQDGFSLKGKSINGALSRSKGTAAVNVDDCSLNLDTKNKSIKATAGGIDLGVDCDSVMIKGKDFSGEISKTRGVAANINEIGSVTLDKQRKTVSVVSNDCEFNAGKDGISGRIDEVGFELDNKNKTMSVNAADTSADVVLSNKNPNIEIKNKNVKLNANKQGLVAEYDNNCNGKDNIWGVVKIDKNRKSISALLKQFDLTAGGSIGLNLNNLNGLPSNTVMMNENGVIANINGNVLFVNKQQLLKKHMSFIDDAFCVGKQIEHGVKNTKKLLENVGPFLDTVNFDQSIKFVKQNANLTKLPKLLNIQQAFKQSKQIETYSKMVGKLLLQSPSSSDSNINNIKQNMFKVCLFDPLHYNQQMKQMPFVLNMLKLILKNQINFDETLNVKILTQFLANMNSTFYNPKIYLLITAIINPNNIALESLISQIDALDEHAIKPKQHQIQNTVNQVHSLLYNCDELIKLVTNESDGDNCANMNVKVVTESVISKMKGRGNVLKHWFQQTTVKSRIRCFPYCNELKEHLGLAPLPIELLSGSKPLSIRDVLKHLTPYLGTISKQAIEFLTGPLFIETKIGRHKNINKGGKGKDTNNVLTYEASISQIIGHSILIYLFSGNGNKSKTCLSNDTIVGLYSILNHPLIIGRSLSWQQKYHIFKGLFVQFPDLSMLLDCANGIYLNLPVTNEQLLFIIDKIGYGSDMTILNRILSMNKNVMENSIFEGNNGGIKDQSNKIKNVYNTCLKPFVVHVDELKVYPKLIQVFNKLDASMAGIEITKHLLTTLTNVPSSIASTVSKILDSAANSECFNKNDKLASIDVGEAKEFVLTVIGSQIKCKFAKRCIMEFVETGDNENKCDMDLALERMLSDNCFNVPKSIISTFMNLYVVNKRLKQDENGDSIDTNVRDMCMVDNTLENCYKQCLGSDLFELMINLLHKNQLKKEIVVGVIGDELPPVLVNVIQYCLKLQDNQSIGGSNTTNIDEDSVTTTTTTPDNNIQNASNDGNESKDEKEIKSENEEEMNEISLETMIGDRIKLSQYLPGNDLPVLVPLLINQIHLNKHNVSGNKKLNTKSDHFGNTKWLVYQWIQRQIQSAQHAQAIGSRGTRKIPSIINGLIDNYSENNSSNNLLDQVFKILCVMLGGNFGFLAHYCNLLWKIKGKQMATNKMDVLLNKLIQHQCHREISASIFEVSKSKVNSKQKRSNKTGDEHKNDNKKQNKALNNSTESQVKSSLANTVRSNEDEDNLANKSNTSNSTVVDVSPIADNCKDEKEDKKENEATHIVTDESQDKKQADASDDCKANKQQHPPTQADVSNDEAQATSPETSVDANTGNEPNDKPDESQQDEKQEMKQVDDETSNDNDQIKHVSTEKIKEKIQINTKTEKIVHAPNLLSHCRTSLSLTNIPPLLVNSLQESLSRMQNSTNKKDYRNIKILLTYLAQEMELYPSDLHRLLISLLLTDKNNKITFSQINELIENAIEQIGIPLQRRLLRVCWTEYFNNINKDKNVATGKNKKSTSKKDLSMSATAVEKEILYTPLLCSLLEHINLSNNAAIVFSRILLQLKPELLKNELNLVLNHKIQMIKREINPKPKFNQHHHKPKMEKKAPLIKLEIIKLIQQYICSKTSRNSRSNSSSAREVSNIQLLNHMVNRIDYWQSGMMKSIDSICRYLESLLSSRYSNKKKNDVILQLTPKDVLKFVDKKLGENLIMQQIGDIITYQDDGDRSYNKLNGLVKSLQSLMEHLESILVKSNINISKSEKKIEKLIKTIKRKKTFRNASVLQQWFDDAIAVLRAIISRNEKRQSTVSIKLTTRQQTLQQQQQEALYLLVQFESLISLQIRRFIGNESYCKQNNVSSEDYEFKLYNQLFSMQSYVTKKLAWDLASIVSCMNNASNGNSSSSNNKSNIATAKKLSTKCIMHLVNIFTDLSEIECDLIIRCMNSSESWFMLYDELMDCNEIKSQSKSNNRLICSNMSVPDIQNRIGQSLTKYILTKLPKEMGDHLSSVIKKSDSDAPLENWTKVSIVSLCNSLLDNMEDELTPQTRQIVNFLTHSKISNKKKERKATKNAEKNKFTAKSNIDKNNHTNTHEQESKSSNETTVASNNESEMDTESKTLDENEVENDKPNETKTTSPASDVAPGKATTPKNPDGKADGKADDKQDDMQDAHDAEIKVEQKLRETDAEKKTEEKHDEASNRFKLLKTLGSKIASAGASAMSMLAPLSSTTQSNGESYGVKGKELKSIVNSFVELLGVTPTVSKLLKSIISQKRPNEDTIVDWLSEMTITLCEHATNIKNSNKNNDKDNANGSSNTNEFTSLTFLARALTALDTEVNNNGVELYIYILLHLKNNPLCPSLGMVLLHRLKHGNYENMDVEWIAMLALDMKSKLKTGGNVDSQDDETKNKISKQKLKKYSNNQEEKPRAGQSKKSTLTSTSISKSKSTSKSNTNDEMYWASVIVESIYYLTNNDTSNIILQLIDQSCKAMNIQEFSQSCYRYKQSVYERRKRRHNRGDKLKNSKNKNERIPIELNELMSWIVDSWLPIMNNVNDSQQQIIQNLFFDVNSDDDSNSLDNNDRIATMIFHIIVHKLVNLEMIDVKNSGDFVATLLSIRSNIFIDMKAVWHNILPKTIPSILKRLLSNIENSVSTARGNYNQTTRSMDRMIVNSVIASVLDDETEFCQLCTKWIFDFGEDKDDIGVEFINDFRLFISQIVGYIADIETSFSNFEFENSNAALKLLLKSSLSGFENMMNEILAMLVSQECLQNNIPRELSAMIQLIYASSINEQAKAVGIRDLVSLIKPPKKLSGIRNVNGNSNSNHESSAIEQLQLWNEMICKNRYNSDENENEKQLVILKHFVDLASKAEKINARKVEHFKNISKDLKTILDDRKWKNVDFSSNPAVYNIMEVLFSESNDNNASKIKIQMKQIRNTIKNFTRKNDKNVQTSMRKRTRSGYNKSVKKELKNNELDEIALTLYALSNVQSLSKQGKQYNWHPVMEWILKECDKNNQCHEMYGTCFNSLIKLIDMRLNGKNGFDLIDCGKEKYFDDLINGICQNSQSKLVLRSIHGLNVNRNDLTNFAMHSLGFGNVEQLSQLRSLISNNGDNKSKDDDNDNKEDADGHGKEISNMIRSLMVKISESKKSVVEYTWWKDECLLDELAKIVQHCFNLHLINDACTLQFIIIYAKFNLKLNETDCNSRPTLKTLVIEFFTWLMSKNLMDKSFSEDIMLIAKMLYGLRMKSVTNADIIPSMNGNDDNGTATRRRMIKAGACIQRLSNNFNRVKQLNYLVNQFNGVKV